MGFRKKIKDLYERVADNIPDFLKKAWDTLKNRMKDWRKDMKKCAKPWTHQIYEDHWRVYFENPRWEYYIAKLEPNSIITDEDPIEFADQDLHFFFFSKYDNATDDFELIASSITHTTQEIKDIVKSYNLSSHLLKI